MDYVIIFCIITFLFICYFFYNNRQKSQKNIHSINFNDINILHCKELIKIGDYYNYHLEDHNKAILYYNKIINKLSPKDYLYNLCKDKVKDCEKSILYKKIVDYENIYNFQLQEIKNGWDNSVIETPVIPNELNTQNTTINNTPVEIPIDIPYNIFDIIEYDFNADDQNVHDNHLNASIKESIRHMENTPDNNISDEEMFNLIISKCYNEEDKEIVKNVLSRIKEYQIKNVNTDMTNLELLEKIVYNILIIENEIERVDCFNFLITNLKDCIDENGKIVCCMGITNRLIQSLSIANDKINLKNKDLYNSEILNLIAKLRNDTGEDNLKERAIELLKKEYVESGILQQYQLDDIIRDWIDYI